MERSWYLCVVVADVPLAFVSLHLTTCFLLSVNTFSSVLSFLISLLVLIIATPFPLSYLSSSPVESWLLQHLFLCLIFPHLPLRPDYCNTFSSVLSFLISRWVLTIATPFPLSYLSSSPVESWLLQHLFLCLIFPHLPLRPDYCNLTFLLTFPHLPLSPDYCLCLIFPHLPLSPDYCNTFSSVLSPISRWVLIIAFSSVLSLSYLSSSPFETWLLQHLFLCLIFPHLPLSPDYCNTFSSVLSFLWLLQHLFLCLIFPHLPLRPDYCKTFSSETWLLQHLFLCLTFPHLPLSPDYCNTFSSVLPFLISRWVLTIATPFPLSCLSSSPVETWLLQHLFLSYLSSSPFETWLLQHLFLCLTFPHLPLRPDYCNTFSSVLPFLISRRVLTTATPFPLSYLSSSPVESWLLQHLFLCLTFPHLPLSPDYCNTFSSVLSFLISRWVLTTATPFPLSYLSSSPFETWLLQHLFLCLTFPHLPLSPDYCNTFSSVLPFLISRWVLTIATPFPLSYLSSSPVESWLLQHLFLCLIFPHLPLSPDYCNTFSSVLPFLISRWVLTTATPFPLSCLSSSPVESWLLQHLFLCLAFPHLPLSPDYCNTFSSVLPFLISRWVLTIATPFPLSYLSSSPVESWLLQHLFLCLAFPHLPLSPDYCNTFSSVLPFLISRWVLTTATPFPLSCLSSSPVESWLLQHLFLCLTFPHLPLSPDYCNTFSSVLPFLISRWVLTIATPFPLSCLSSSPVESWLLQHLFLCLAFPHLPLSPDYCNTFSSVLPFLISRWVLTTATPFPLSCLSSSPVESWLLQHLFLCLAFPHLPLSPDYCNTFSSVLPFLISRWVLTTATPFPLSCLSSSPVESWLLQHLFLCLAFPHLPLSPDYCNTFSSVLPFLISRRVLTIATPFPLSYLSSSPVESWLLQHLFLCLAFPHLPLSPDYCNTFSSVLPFLISRRVLTIATPFPLSCLSSSPVESWLLQHLFLCLAFPHLPLSPDYCNTFSSVLSFLISRRVLTTATPFPLSCLSSSPVESWLLQHLFLCLIFPHLPLSPDYCNTFSSVLPFLISRWVLTTATPFPLSYLSSSPVESWLLQHLFLCLAFPHLPLSPDYCNTFSSVLPFLISRWVLTTATPFPLSYLSSSPVESWLLQHLFLCLAFPHLPLSPDYCNTFSSVLSFLISRWVLTTATPFPLSYLSSSPVESWLLQHLFLCLTFPHLPLSPDYCNTFSSVLSFLISHRVLTIATPFPLSCIPLISLRVLTNVTAFLPSTIPYGCRYVMIRRLLVVVVWQYRDC